MKVGKILGCLKFGRADGPPFMKFFTRGSDQQKIAARTVRPITADGPPDAPVSFGYTDNMSTKQAPTVRQGSVDGLGGIGRSEQLRSVRRLCIGVIGWHVMQVRTVRK